MRGLTVLCTLAGLLLPALRCLADVRYAYSGREADASDLLYYRARYYDATLGRYTQRDPLGLGGGIDDYTYVDDQPVDARDPTGLLASDAEPDIGPLGRYWDQRLSILHPTAGPPPRPAGEALQALGLSALFAVNATAFGATALLATIVHQNFGEGGLALLFGPPRHGGGPPLQAGEILFAYRGTVVPPRQALALGLRAAEHSELGAQHRLLDPSWRTPVLFASESLEQATAFGAMRATLTAVEARLPPGPKPFWVYRFRVPEEAIIAREYYRAKGLLAQVTEHDLALREILVPQRIAPHLIIEVHPGTTAGFGQLAPALRNPAYIPR